MEDLLTKPKTKIAPPQMFNVILLNDDYTPIDFVVLILVDVFRRSVEEAVTLTMEAHNKGKAIAGTYTRDVAETLIAKAEGMAKEFEFPFKMGLEAA